MRQPTITDLFTMDVRELPQGQAPSAAGLAEGRRRRDVGHAVAESHADDALSSAVWDALEMACRRLPELSSDDVWDMLEQVPFDAPMPKRLNLMGAVMRKAQLQGWLVPTGRYIKTRRADGHSRAIPVYASQRYQPPSRQSREEAS